MNNIIKIKDGYCHILADRLVISKTTGMDDLVRDYEESVNNLLKTLMVFFIFLPVFTLLAVVFYNLGKISLTIYTGSFGLFWLIMAFYMMLYTSASPVIKKECIEKVEIRKVLFNQVGVFILFKDLRRKKRRFLMIEKDTADIVKEILLSEKLIKIKDVDHKSRGINIVAFAVVIAITSTPIWMLNKDHNAMMTYYGSMIALLSTVLLVAMFKNIMKSN